MVVAVEHQEDSLTENSKTKDAEGPKEILHIVSEVGSIVLLVPFMNLFAFIGKHRLDLTDMYL